MVTLSDVFKTFTQKFSYHRRSEIQLQAAIEAAGFVLSDVDDRFWNILDPEWIEGDDDYAPFALHDPPGSCRNKCLKYLEICRLKGIPKEPIS